MDYSMEVSVLGDRISIGEEAHVITLGVNTGFPAGSTAGLAYTLSPLQARVPARRCARPRTPRRGIRACRPTRR